MIKKFNEYFNEGISQEEIEDYFLRLKEVYDCKISTQKASKKNIGDPISSTKYSIHIECPSSSKTEPNLILLDEINEEIMIIKERLTDSLYNLTRGYPIIRMYIDPGRQFEHEKKIYYCSYLVTIYHSGYYT